MLQAATLSFLSEDILYSQNVLLTVKENDSYAYESHPCAGSMLTVNNAGVIFLDGVYLPKGYHRLFWNGSQWVRLSVDDIGPLNFGLFPLTWYRAYESALEEARCV